MANETATADVLERRRTLGQVSDRLGSSGVGASLITMWLEVRVLPGPPVLSISRIGTSGHLCSWRAADHPWRRGRRGCGVAAAANTDQDDACARAGLAALDTHS